MNFSAMATRIIGSLLVALVLACSSAYIELEKLIVKIDMMEKDRIKEELSQWKFMQELYDKVNEEH